MWPAAPVRRVYARALGDTPGGRSISLHHAQGRLTSLLQHPCDMLTPAYTTM